MRCIGMAFITYKVPYFTSKALFEDLKIRAPTYKNGNKELLKGAQQIVFKGIFCSVLNL